MFSRSSLLRSSRHLNQWLSSTSHHKRFLSSLSSSSSTSSTSSSSSSSRLLLALVASGGAAVLLGSSGILLAEDLHSSLGDVYLWGNNAHCLIPGSPESVVREPKRISFFDGKTLKALSLAQTHAAAVDSEGNVFQWGDGFAMGTKGEPSLPVKTLEGQAVVSVSCGAMYCYALNSEGKVFVLGSKEFNERTFQRATKSGWISSKQVLEPTVVQMPEDLRRERIVAIDSGENHLVAVTQAGKLLTMHEGKWRLVRGLESEHVIQATCGSNHTLLLCKSGKVFGFGSNSFLQLCTNTYKPNLVTIETPRLIDDPQFHEGGRQVTAIGAGGDTSYLVVNGPKTSEVFSFGTGLFGQLGNGRFLHMSGTPVRVHEISGRHYYDEITKKVAPIRVRGIEAGGNHVAAILDTKQGNSGAFVSDTVFVWGLNKEGQLGIESKANQAQPVAARGLIPSATSSTAPEFAQGSNILMLYGMKGKFVQGIAGGPDTTGVFTRERERKK